MERNIDLHIHTNLSDGALSPREVIDEAKKNNVKIISIADHDTLIAYTPEIINYAKDNDITLIPGVEISTRLGTGFHVLGYNVDINNEKLLQTLSMLKNARLDYLEKVAKLLQDLGYYINVEELKALPTVTKAHISQNIISDERNKELLIKTFGHMPNKGEYIETIMNEDCPAFVEKFSITPMQASQIIHEAGGKAILAHPVAYTHEDKISVDKIKNIVQQMNADGIESNYLYVDKDNNFFDETEFWNNFAKENNLLVTAGSDFHSFDPLRPNIGFTNMQLHLSDEEINNIVKNLNK